MRSIAFLLTLALTYNCWSEPVTAVLRVKQRVRMSDLAASTRSPASQKYKDHYTPEEIKDLSAPTDQEYQETLSKLKAEGFQIVSESSTHLWISVKADHSLFEKVFGAQMQTNSAHQYRNLRALSVPSQLSQIEAVIGLNNTRKSYPRFIRRPESRASQPGGISPATIKTAYNFNPIYGAGITGKGQHIAIATYDGFKIKDVQQFYKLSNLSPTPKVDQVKFNGTPAYSENSAMETQLDAEMSGMIAPGAKVHVFASATNDDAGELAMFTAILDDNRAQVVNYSWGGCETQLDPTHQSEMDQVFARAVAQGVNIMVASGDNGSDSCGDKTTAADWPAANPNVVAVGGTTLSVNKNGSASEVAWSGSGGGISSLFDLPVWQNDLGAPYVKRTYPDVSFNADPNSGQAIYAHNNGKAGWIVIGGTSMAAPQWSGFLALVAQARSNQSRAPLGFLNPIIYGLSSSQIKSDFNDVTSGSNGAYNAGPGFDAVTGLGSMNAALLLQDLTNF